MPFPPVVVDVGPPPAPPELSATLTAACSNAVPEGGCVLSSQPGRPARPRAVVYVTWQEPDHRVADLSVTMGESGAGRQVVRTLTFRAADAVIERWRAVGYAAGALVDEQEVEVATIRTPSPPETKEPEEGPGQSPSAPEVRPVWLGAGGLAAPGLEDGTWRFGGWVRADLTFEAVPLLVSAAASYAASPEDDRGLNATWVTVAAGTGAHLLWPAARLGFRLRIEVMAERLGVWARSEGTGLEDSGARWAVGPRLGLDGCWPQDGMLSAVLGVTGWTLSDDTTIRMHGQDAAGVPWAGVALGLGARLSLP